MMTTLISDFERDIARTVVLGKYIEDWGFPLSRRVLSRGERICVEAYEFPARDGVTRFATFGISQEQRLDGRQGKIELLFCVDSTGSCAAKESFVDLLFDLSTSYLSSSIEFVPPYLVGNVSRKIGGFDSLLLDEPRGERPELAEICIARHHIAVLWMIPIFSAELSMIEEKGIEAFDSAVDRARVSLIDLDRKSVASTLR